MLKKLLSVTLAGLLVNMFAVAPVGAGTKTKQDKAAQKAEKVKQAVNKLGTGERARIKVKLKDETRVRGYVSQIGADDFQITDAKTGTATTVAYAQVKQIEGKNLTTGQKVAIGVGIAAIVLIIVALVGIHQFREDCCF
jgi:hypothetical protein